MANFRELSKLVISENAGRQVSNKEELKQTLLSLLTDTVERRMLVENGARLLENNQGSLQATCRLLAGVINP